MSNQTEEELKRAKKLKILSQAFGTAGSLEDLVGQAFRQPAFKTPRHQDTIRKRSQDLRPCLLYTSPSPRDGLLSRMPSSA